MSNYNSTKNIVDIPSFNLQANPFSFSYEKCNFSYSLGKIITIWDIHNDTKIYTNSSYSPIKEIKQFRGGKYLLTLELVEKEFILSLYSNQNNSITYFNEKKVKLPINKEDIKRIAIIDINPRNEFIIMISAYEQKSYIFHGSIDKQTLEISASLYKKIDIKQKIKKSLIIWDKLWLICSNSSLICTVDLNLSNSSIIYQIENSQRDFISDSLVIIDKANKKNDIAILTKSGECFIYDCFYRLIRKINYDDYFISSISLYDGTLFVGTKESNIIAFDTMNYNERYILDLSSNYYSSMIKNLFVLEQKDLFIISLEIGYIIKGSISALLKKKKGFDITPISISHSSYISSINAPSNQADSPFYFFTIGMDGSIYKWYYRGDIWTNYSFRSDAKFTAAKIHPKYQNLLYVGDNFGNMFVFNVDSDEIRITNKFKVANCAVDQISFDENKDNIVAIGYSNGMIMIYRVEENQGIFLVRLCDDYMEDHIIEQKKKMNYIKSFVYFFKYETKKCIYLSKENTLSISNFNYINNQIVKMIEDEISYEKKNLIINDIKIHPSEKYAIILLNNNQIDIRETKNYSTSGVIDLKGGYGLNFIIDTSGEFIFVNEEKEQNKIIEVFELKKGKKIDEIKDLFNVSKFSILKDGKYIMLCGFDGSMCILNNIQKIKRAIFNYKDEERTKSQEYIWDKFDITYEYERTILKEIMKEKNVNKKDKENKTFILNEEVILHNTKNKYSNTYPTIQRKNDTNNDIYNENNAENPKKVDNKIRQKNNYDKMIVNNMNNIYNSQTIPSSVYNNKTQESFRNHNEKVNETWNKNHQYSKIGFEHRNFVSLNADPSIFPVSQMHILEKVDKNYLKSQSLKYPKMMTNLVENASKKQQDSIRYSNINNAIKNVLQPPVQSQTYRQSSNYNNISNSNNISIRSNRYNKGNEDNNYSQNNKSYHSQRNNESISSKNSYYINNNIGNIQSKNKRFNEPDTIDNMTNNSLTYNRSITKDIENSVSRVNQTTTNNGNNINNMSKKDNYEDFSIISTISRNGKYSIADDIDYISDGIERFEYENRNILKNAK